MSCGVTCARILLIAFTAVLSLVGILVLTAGLLLKFGSETFLKTLSVQAPNNSSDNTTTSTPAINPTPLLDSICITLISFGSVLAVISLLGFFGACCKSKCLLYLYALAIGIIGLALIILSSIILSGAANERIQKEILKTIVNDYQGLKYSDMASLIWNVVMNQFNCCGLHSYEDFNSSKKWNRNVTYQNLSFTLVTPVACCKMNGTFSGEITPGDITPSDVQCAIDPNDDISNWKKGCWVEVMLYVTVYKPFIALTVAGILIVEVFIILWACLVANKMNKVCPA